MVSENDILKAFDILEKHTSKEYVQCIAVILPNIPLGCSWGFVTDAQAREMKITPHTKIDGISIFKLSNGYMIYQELMSIVEQFKACGVVDLFQESFFDNAIKFYNKSLERLRKVKDSHICFASINESPRISINGKFYPSFNVSPVDFLQIVHERGGYLVAGSETYTAGSFNNVEDLLRMCPLAPSGNGLLSIVKW